MTTTPATGAAMLPACEGVRVLLVDDDPAARRVARGLLAVAEAGDGRAALTLAGRVGPSVVVADLAVRRSGMFGLLTLLHRLRQADRLLMVVVHTGVADLRVHRAAYGAGAFEVLRKGGSGGALVAAVRAAHVARSGLRRRENC
jgi:CheY-like chemotaxis protein